MFFQIFLIIDINKDLKTTPNFFLKMNLVNELRVRSTHLKPMMQVGKNGLTDSVIAEMLKILKKKKLLKIKLTRGILDDRNKKEVAQEIAEKADCVIVSLVGFNLTIFPKKYLEKND